MSRTVSDRDPERRDALRGAGSDRVEPQGVRAGGSEFGDECQRQSAVVAASDAADRDLIDFLDAALDDVGRRMNKVRRPR